MRDASRIRTIVTLDAGGVLVGRRRRSAGDGGIVGPAKRAADEKGVDQPVSSSWGAASWPRLEG